MKLNFKSYGQGPALLILHGLFGSLDNWLTHARNLEADYSVYLIDLRNHGRSPHSDSFDYRVMAEDLYELMEAEGILSAHLLGHSMGGKVVMEFAGLYPEKVDKLIVADMGIKQYPPHHTAVFEALTSIDLSVIPSRKAAEAFLMQKLDNDVVTTQFLLKGLGRDAANQFIWKFNFPAILGNYSAILAGVSPEIFEKPTLFLSGGNSSYILESDHAAIRSHFPLAQFEVMEGVGHWLHAENPSLFLEKVRHFLTE